MKLAALELIFDNILICLLREKCLALIKAVYILNEVSSVLRISSL